MKWSISIIERTRIPKVRFFSQRLYHKLMSYVLKRMIHHPLTMGKECDTVVQPYEKWIQSEKVYFCRVNWKLLPPLQLVLTGNDFERQKKTQGVEDVSIYRHLKTNEEIFCFFFFFGKFSFISSSRYFTFLYRGF